MKTILSKLSRAALAAPVALAAALFIAAVTIGCGGAKHTSVIMAPDYKKQFAINADLAVMMRGKPEIIYRGDALKSLSTVNNEGLTDPRALIEKYFTAQLVRDIEREVDVKYAFVTENSQRYLVTREVVTTKEEDVMVEIPDVRTRILFDIEGGSTEPALVLFIDEMRVGTETDPYYADRAQHGVYTATPRSLVYVGSFVLWDNRELKYICYGRVKSSVPISREEATIANWEEVSRNFVRQIFQSTGFLKRKDR